MWFYGNISIKTPAIARVDPWGGANPAKGLKPPQAVIIIIIAY